MTVLNYVDMYLRLQVSMHDFQIVQMIQSRSDHSKPVQDGLFVKCLFVFQLSLNYFLQIFFAQLNQQPVKTQQVSSIKELMKVIKQLILETTDWNGKIELRTIQRKLNKLLKNRKQQF